MKPLVTVVVCCHNGSATLPATVQALANQTLAGQIEILVVDDGSTDDTAAVAEVLGVRVVRHEINRGLAAARNTGWQAAHAELVAFTDDDCRPEPTWLALLLAAAERHPSYAAIGGALIVCGEDGVVLRYLRRNNPLTPLEADLLVGDGFLHRLALYIKRSGSSPSTEGERPVSSIVGANMLFPVDVLAAYGFDERFRFGGEEEDLCRRLVKDGLELVFVPTARVQHDFESGLGDTLRRSRAYGRGNARMFLKHTGLTPTVYPLPFVVGSLLAFSMAYRSRAAAAAAAVAPLLLFSRWPREAARDRSTEVLLYPYLQLAQEAWGNVGLIEGLRQFRSDFAVEGALHEGTDSGAAPINIRHAPVRLP